MSPRPLGQRRRLRKAPPPPPAGRPATDQEREDWYDWLAEVLDPYVYRPCRRCGVELVDLASEIEAARGHYPNHCDDCYRAIKTGAMTTA